ALEDILLGKRKINAARKVEAVDRAHAVPLSGHRLAQHNTGAVEFRFLSLLNRPSVINRER
ncbi:MAG: hypothetical protein Q4G41_01785, partial [Coriobacteriales bacterium]|nr:hypothetical protein [Coriobacteriales bacterium]